MLYFCFPSMSLPKWNGYVMPLVYAKILPFSRSFVWAMLACRMVLLPFTRQAVQATRVL